MYIIKKTHEIGAVRSSPDGWTDALELNGVKETHGVKETSVQQTTAPPNGMKSHVITERVVQYSPAQMGGRTHIFLRTHCGVLSTLVAQAFSCGCGWATHKHLLRSHESAVANEEFRFCGTSQLCP